MFERLSRRLASSVLWWDLLCTLLALYLATQIRIWLPFGNPILGPGFLTPWHLYPLVGCIWAVIFLLLAPQRALFSSRIVEATGRLLAAVSLAALVFAGCLYLSFRDFSRLQFVYFTALDFVLLLAVHFFMRFYVHGHFNAGWSRRALIVGAGSQARLLMQEFERRPWAGVQIVGCTSDEPGDAGVPILGPINMTRQLVAEHHIDEVIFVIPDHDIVTRLSLQLLEQPVMLHMVPSALDLSFARTPAESLGGIPLISLRESALTEPQLLLKRLFDVVGSVLLLLLCSPLLVLIAIAIKLESPGPIFFLQERIGEHGQHFKMLKFRSMQQGAELRWQEVATRDDQGNLIHKRDNDPRITRVGQKIRRMSLDELPQLLNVLRGDMSLVGPRPEMPLLVAEYEPWQWQRFRVPPGITGWWQVNGRSDRPMHLHTEDDLYYIQNYSFWLDLKILVMTIGTVLKGHGAF